jgi:hypothetical protein
MKKIITILILIIAIVAVYFIGKNASKDNPPPSTPLTTNEPVPLATSTQPVVDTTKTVIGKSVEGRDITAYHFGTGSSEVLFVGGIHGGYGWNTSLLAYDITDYLRANPDVVPEEVKVTIIPVLNPDGLNKTVGTSSGEFSKSDVPSLNETVAGRFNANNVDLNRNFDCDWKTEGVWQNKTVDGGSSAFSEPESQAVRSYIETKDPSAVIVWYSAAGGVFASNCHTGVLSDTNELIKAFSKGSGYPSYSSFDFYATTGDMTNWLAKIGVPAISVLLTNHTDTEYDKNLGGLKAILDYYSN